MIVLGLTHPISWNSAAVLLLDDKIVGAAEEERFVRIKHAPRMIPYHAIEYVLRQANIRHNDVDAVAIGWQGPRTISEAQLASSSRSLRIPYTAETERDFLTQSAEKESIFMNFLHHEFRNSRVFFVKHHLAHAASACYPSGYDRSMFLTIDGRGEFESGLMGIYDHGEFEVLRSFDLNESLGNMYSHFTALIGLREHTDEGKVMGLAAYGNPVQSLLDIASFNDDRIEIDWGKIGSLFSAYRDYAGDPTKDARKDLAATVQHLLEKCAIRLVERLQQVSGSRNICLAGGCALNIDMNGAILSSGLVRDIFVQPASHDAGCALGAALYIHHRFSSSKLKTMEHAYLGPKLGDSETKSYLDNCGLKYTVLSDIPSEIAELISKNKIVGWVQGRAEFGPRALGSRSMLANPTDPRMGKLVNKAKGREYWRPLAPSVTEEAAPGFFCNPYVKSPFMLLRFAVREERVKDVPAIVHIDKSARPQTVSRENNQLFWNLLTAFQRIKGVPMLINTSLNLSGEPIVNNIQDAVKTLYCSEMDSLCVGKYLVFKSY
jgi:carbamoyltransferase